LVCALSVLTVQVQLAGDLGLGQPPAINCSNFQLAGRQRLYDWGWLIAD
jgi:hypothetical protein